VHVLCHLLSRYAESLHIFHPLLIKTKIEVISESLLEDNAKRKIVPMHTMKTHEEVETHLHWIWNSDPDEVNSQSQLYASVTLPLEKEPIAPTE